MIMFLVPMNLVNGGMLVKVNDNYIFYGDTWQSYKRYIVGVSKDLQNFKNFTRPNSLIEKRHGSILYINDKNLINYITSLDSYNLFTDINTPEKTQIILQGEYDNLRIFPDFFYRINDDTTINTLENDYLLPFFNFAFTAKNNAVLKINNIISPNQNKLANLTIYNSSDKNGLLNKVNLIGDTYADWSGGVTDINNSLLETLDGWTVSIYNLKKYGNIVHLEADLKKTSDTATSSVANIKSGIRPLWYTFLPNRQHKTCWVGYDNILHCSSNVNETVYVVGDYLIP